MKQQLRKSTVNRKMRTFVNKCDCTCYSHCDPSTSSWYPKEAHSGEDNTVFNVYYNREN